LGKDDFIVGMLHAAPGTNEMVGEIRRLNSANVFILARILKRCAKQFISLVDKWERGEEV